MNRMKQEAMIRLRKEIERWISPKYIAKRNCKKLGQEKKMTSKRREEIKEKK